MNTALRLIGIATFVWLTCFTGAKLIKMAQIRGFISGPVAESKIITAKTTEPGRHSDVHWIAWNDADIHVPSHDRMNLPQGVWETFALGDPIEVFYFPGDPWPYHRKGIFADDGNFAFDIVLLSVWLAGIAILSMFQFFHRNRRGVPPPLPSS